jgi:hypothetical protein
VVVISALWCRLTELLVSTSGDVEPLCVSTSSRFASDMTGAFALDSAAASDSDAELVLSDGRVAHVHRAVLTSGSAYFRGCFESMLADPTRRRIDVSEDDAHWCWRCWSTCIAASASLTTSLAGEWWSC